MPASLLARFRKSRPRPVRAHRRQRRFVPVLRPLEDRVTPAGLVKVNPGNMDGWAVQTSGTASVTFEAGPPPLPPPLGEGSVELAVGTNGNSGAQVRNNEYAGTQLSDLTTLRYSTYVDNDSTNPLAGPDQAPYLILNVDLDGNLATTSDRTLLFFEPEYQFGYTTAVPPQGPIVMDTWQEWDALIGGWWSTTGAAGAGPGADVKPLSAIIAAYPNATIVNSGTDGLSGAGGVRIVAGFGAGAWDNFVGNADKFIIGVNGDTTTYDFDPGPVITSITDTPDPSEEGELVTVTATFTDVAPNVVYTATIDWGDGTGPQPATYNPVTGEVTGTHTYMDDNPSGTPSDPYTITVTVTDPFGNTGVGTTQHTVTNVAPEVQTLTGPVAPQPVGTPVTINATFTDQGTQDTHTATIDWGDGNVTAGVVTEAGGSGSVTGTHTYTTPGVYVVTVTVTDDDTGSGSMSSDEAVPVPFFVVIFDAQGGFVTGGGWYDSPAGAAPASPTAVGKAQFGLNARYHQDQLVPHGQFHLNFKPADIKFRSTQLTFLGVAGNTATIRGEGTNNGTGQYAFRVEVQDNGEPGDDDTIHVKIWQKVDPAGAIETFVLYDNAVPTPLGGGNIQIHQALQALTAGSRAATEPLTADQLGPIVDEAVGRGRATGIGEDRLAAVRAADVGVADLPGTDLGITAAGVVRIDRDAAGHGWFVDPTPADDHEFGAGPAPLGMDLLTVVTHELGHLLGLDHGDGPAVMSETLEPGVRLDPESAHHPDAGTVAPAELPAAGPASEPIGVSPDWSWTQADVFAPVEREDANAATDPADEDTAAPAPRPVAGDEPPTGALDPLFPSLGDDWLDDESLRPAEPGDAP